MMNMPDEYQTLITTGESLFKDKGSKFFGYAFPVADEEEIKRILEEVRGLHPKARHHCFAWRLGYEGENYRANDDGEPSGSAGKPILNALISCEVTFALVIVVRYFGGTLLGVPGLIHAYKQAAAEALAVTEKEVRTMNTPVRIDYDFEQTNAVMQLIKKLNLTVKEQTFEERCGVVLEVRNAYIEKIREELRDFWTIRIRVPGDKD
ncbi:YigZ family protein [Leadbetterella sp. DM7]|uniref:IMPACT family protein n=1 Tax=Leadbetterella sp. DM7 TaxID=3235085 RepID=UPI00349E7EC7